jgi:hypothetical protein
MKRLVVLGIMVMMLGCASWAGAYTYGVSGNYGVFGNNSGADAVVDLELWYGNGSIKSHYAYSLGGTIWTSIPRGNDGQLWTSSVIDNNGSFWLKFVGGSGSDMDLTSSDTSDPAPYWFAFNSGDYFQNPIHGCVALVEGSSAVPIPAAVWLLGSGLGTLLVARRKRKA